MPAQPITQSWDGRGSALAFVASKNLHRRHLTESLRAMVAAKIATMKHGSNQLSEKRSCPLATPLTVTPQISRGEAAETMNVGVRSEQSAHTPGLSGIGSRACGDVYQQIAKSYAMASMQGTNSLWCGHMRQSIAALAFLLLMTEATAYRANVRRVGGFRFCH